MLFKRAGGVLLFDLEAVKEARRKKAEIAGAATEEDANDADKAESSAVVDGATESTEDAIKSTLDPISSELGPGIALILSCRQIYHESIGVCSIYCSWPSSLET